MLTVPELTTVTVNLFWITVKAAVADRSSLNWTGQDVAMPLHGPVQFGGLHPNGVEACKVAVAN
jgi:hypothetical protein